MLAPSRDYLSPEEPLSSPLIRMTKSHYFGQLSLTVDPEEPEFGETGRIVSEDVNVEHLLKFFTFINPNSNVWDSCVDFLNHLWWYKPRPVVPGPKVEAPPDDHPSKPLYLLFLSGLFLSIGNWCSYLI